MRHGIYCANFGALGDPSVLIEIAGRADAAGWEGFFLFDHLQIVPSRPVPIADPWIVLASVAAQTKLRLGPLVTPLARRLPWEVASQALTLHRLSEGRLTLGVGLGEELDFTSFGDHSTPAARAARLDESLELLSSFWRGEPVVHSGQWQVEGAAMAAPVGGKIPIWIAGRYPHRAPIARATRYDGYFPIAKEWDVHRPLLPAELAHLVATARELRGDLDGFDIVTTGITAADLREAKKVTAEYERAGATWWLEVLAPTRGSLAEMLVRVDSGPAINPVGS